MTDPYRRYAAAPRTSVPPPLTSDRGGSIPNPSFPGYIYPEASTLTSYDPYNPKDQRLDSLDLLQNDILSSRPGAYTAGSVSSIHPEQRASGLTTGTSIKGYPPPFEDPNLQGYKQDVSSGLRNGVADLTYERPNSVRRSDGLPVPSGQSNVLFVDGLPTDCTRRELGHLFRPFIGFRELRLVHKEPRRRGDKAMALCFVEFTDAKCALTAMEALQGYRFDDRKSESNILKIYFAHFPFRLPSD